MISSFSMATHASVYSVSFISFTILEIRICVVFKLEATIMAFLFPFAPACANPLKTPRTAILSPATTSAPALTSPIITWNKKSV